MRLWKPLPAKRYGARYAFVASSGNRVPSDQRMPHISRPNVAQVLGFVSAAIGAHTSLAAAIDVRALAASCASCHQPAQHAPPSLEGGSREMLASRLRAFRDGTRSGTVMPQIAKGYTTAELDALAAYYAAQPLPR
jgi:cytochrome c553